MATTARQVDSYAGDGASPRVSPAFSRAAPLDFAALREFVCALAAKQRGQATPAEELERVFTHALGHADTVSFDIFDTALIRFVDHPADVFLHLEQHPAFAAHPFHAPLARLRVTAENTARAMVAKLIASYEVNLLEIYQVFCDLAGIGREHAPSFVVAEEQIELALCVANLPLQTLYARAVEAGKRILFISDTYHTQEFLVRLLGACGYPATCQTVFASSAARKSKQSGELFPLVLSMLSLVAERVLHLGDHPVSDYQKALDAGITPILHPHKACRDEWTLLAPEHLPINDHQRGAPEQHGALAAQSFVRGMTLATPQAAVAAGRADDFWWKLGYSAAGPLTVGFCQWLQHRLRADGIEHAYFMLRDGALLHAVYEALYAGDGAACPATSLPTSRRASLLPVLELAPAFVLPSLLGGIGLRPVREYLDRLALDASLFQAEAAIARFRSLDDTIDGRFEMNRLVQLLLQPRVMQALLARSARERAGLEALLQQQGVTSFAKIAFVDLGWGGTVHKSLHILLGKLSPETRATGYYVATFPEAPHSIVPGLAVRSYLAHRGEPQPVYRHILQFLNLFEIVYSSTEGSLLYIEQQADGSPVPVRQASDKSDAQCRHLQAVHAGALAFAHDYKGRVARLALPPIPPAAASENFFRVILQPTPEEARRLGETVHCDNLGSASQHVSARLRAGSDPAALLADYEQAHWKQGLLAQATPETAALRTLLWLASIDAAEWAH